MSDEQPKYKLTRLRLESFILQSSQIVHEVGELSNLSFTIVEVERIDLTLSICYRELFNIIEPKLPI